MSLSTLTGAVDAYDIAAEERRKVREGALGPQLQLAVDIFARSYTLRGWGPPEHVHGYADGREGLIVVARVAVEHARRLPESWVALVSAAIEADTNLVAHRFSVAEDRGLIVLAFSPARRSTDAPRVTRVARFVSGRRVDCIGDAA